MQEEFKTIAPWIRFNKQATHVFELYKFLFDTWIYDTIYKALLAIYNTTMKYEIRLFISLCTIYKKRKKPYQKSFSDCCEVKILEK